MFQSLVEGREVPWSLCVKDVPEDKHQDLDFIIEQLDWEKNVDTHFKENNYLEPIVADSGDGWVDQWIVYGRVDGKQLFSASELTVEPVPSARSKTRRQRLDHGAGQGTMGALNLQTPAMIRFGAGDGRRSVHHARSGDAGVEIANTGSEPLGKSALLRSGRSRLAAQRRRLQEVETGFAWS